MAHLLTFLVVVLGVGTAAMARQREATRTVAAYKAAIHAAMQVKFRAADFNGWQTAYAFDVARAAAAADRKASRVSFLASAAAFRTDLAALGGVRLTGEERQVVADTGQQFEQFMTMDTAVFESYRSGAGDRIAAANKLVAVDEIAIFYRIAADIDRLTRSLDAEADRAVSRAESTSRTAKVLMLAVGGVAILVGSLLAFALVRSITRPLAELNTRLAEIADGDGDLTQRLVESGRDEVAQAAAGFNRFAERVRLLVSQVAARAQDVAHAAQELAAVSTRLAGGAQETSAQTGTLSASAEEVSTIVSTMAAASEEMTASISEISGSASRATLVGAEAMRSAQAARATIDRLGTSSEEIQSVVKLITAIAYQTNLLALNATIEAARAGEAGKGFAVVAGEVRQLAQQTAEATERIAESVAAVRSGSGEVEAAISAIGDVVAEINGTQVSIASAIEEQTATTSEMSRSITETAAGTGTIATGIQDVAATARATSLAARTTQSTAAGLNEASGELRLLVSSFRY